MGMAAGAGFSTALIGDIVLAAKSARFKMAYTDIGLAPDGASSHFLPRIVGMRRAQELMLTNRMLSADEAQDWGIVTRVVEDDDLAVIDKPAGMVVHPAPGNYTGTLVNAILFHCKDLKGVGDQRRPGIVHRLDKGTSGVMVVAKNQKCHEGLVELFSTHDIERRYECIAMGKSFPAGGVLESKIGRHPQNRLKMSVLGNQ